MTPLMQRLQNTIQEHNLLLPLDILLVGATGSGKSSTINAIAKQTLAKVGKGVEPQTQTISAFHLNEYFRLHDSAGLGDCIKADLHHKNMITQQLKKTCSEIGDPSQEYGFIDLVIVILEGGIRDMGTSLHVLESVVLPSIEPERVIIMINQADMLMKGRYWDAQRNEPEPELLTMLAAKAESVQKRIKHSTGITVRIPTHYSAEFGYNIDKVMAQIIEQLPKKRRGVSNATIKG
ncbi:50S ribosome-binding GTPase [Pseudoalteromonas sp. SG43-7]|uniref:GTPase family protein n=1 Tax=Pseudoalteromonas sp. SG43-7 TaxID=2760966 RepID=UPI0016008AE6|nr:GTPase [Pseudoalteromonas sp. SG43-7]MBB1420780.1 50S ribosome-binding GTPase [Pseudoalteromonas sp. SG43-7]